MFRNSTLKALFLLLAIVAIDAAYPSAHFYSLSEDQGLSSRRTFAISQDHYGYMWIATQKGVDRFDGNIIQQYTLLSPSSLNQESIGVNKVEVTQRGDVWAYTNAGLLFCYNVLSDHFDYICSIKEMCTDNSIALTDMAYDASRNSFIIATSLGIYIYDIENHQLSKTTIAGSVFINHINIVGGKIYIASVDGLYIAGYDNESQLQVICHIMKGVNTNVSYLDDLSDRLLVGTINRGLYSCDVATLDNVEQVSTINTNKPIRAIERYENGDVAIGIDLEGVYVLQSKSDRLINHFASDETDLGALSSNNVRDLYIDRDNNLWVATYYSGVAWHTSRKPLFDIIKHKIGDIESIAANNVNVTFEDSKGRLWFGTNRGVSIYDATTEDWEHLFLNLNQEGAAIRVIKEDSYGDIWIGGYSFGVARISAADGSIVRYYDSDRDPLIATNSIYDICVDGDTLYFGGIQGSMTSFNVKTNERQSYNVSKVSRIFRCGEDHLLIGRFDGLYLFDKESGVSKNIGAKNSVIAASTLDNNTFWLGTENQGLYCYNFEQDSLRHFVAPDQLPSNNIYGIIEDRGHNIWVGSETGLFKLTPQLSVESYSGCQDLAKVSFDRSVYAQCRNGKIIIGSVNGAIVFDPNNVNPEADALDFATNTFIRQFDLYNRPVFATTKNSPLKESIYNTDEIRLKYNQNYFSFHFSSINYQAPEQILFSYYLEGYDLEWSVPSTKPVASYSRVTHGKYKFSVRAIINGALQPTQSIDVIIHRPWWNSWWAWCVYLLCVTIILYNIMLRFKESQKRKQTDAKLDFFISTAHDLLTPLNLIQEPLKDLESDTAISQRSYALIQMALNNTMKLSNFIRQLLDFQVLSLNTEQLTLSENQLDSLLEEHISPFRIAAKHKEIEIYTHFDQSARINVQIDREKFVRILDNIISNAIKYTDIGGEITIRAFAKGDKWRLCIKDNGIGISERDQKMLFKHIFRAQNAINSHEMGSGIGLKLVGVLVGVLSGKISFKSKIGVGTEFRLTFPINYSSYSNSVAKAAATAKEQSEKGLPKQVQQRDDHKKPTILIVDDDDDLLEYLDVSLSGQYNTYLCSDGEEALNNIKGKTIDLIISDVSMPNMDGMELCRELKKSRETSHIPVLLVTGRTDRDSILEGLKAGAIDYIKKPFDKDLLINKIVNIFALQQTSHKQFVEELKSANFEAVSSERDREFIERLTSIIEDNLSNPELNISMLSQRLALSKTLLYNRVTQITGKSTIELIRVFRLKKAATLLISGQYSVAEVATLVGIDNPKYFSKIFKEFYGQTPRSYVAKQTNHQPKSDE